MNNTPDYTATLRGWWDNAEDATPSIGDTVISRDDDEAGGSIYTVYVWTEEDAEWRSGARDDRRVLRRAAPPEPAWHDAVAVVASTSDFGIRRVFAKDENGIWNDALSGRGSFEGNLLDVTPLIEAKVTDEMVEAAQQESKRHTGLILERLLVSRMLTAALGLEDA